MGHSIFANSRAIGRKATQWTARGRAIIDRRELCRTSLQLQRAAHSQARAAIDHATETPLQLRPYFRRWADWMLTTDKRQRIRLAMSGLAALLMVFCLVVMNSVAAAGLASTSEVRVWTACSVLGLIAVYAAIRSGWSRRFKDPALTLAQILYAITCCAAAFVIAGPARGVTLPSWPSSSCSASSAHHPPDAGRAGV